MSAGKFRMITKMSENVRSRKRKQAIFNIQNDKSHPTRKKEKEGNIGMLPDKVVVNIC